MAVAVYCVLKYQHDFDKALVAAANKWDEHKYQIVLNGSIAKFSQSERLRGFLLGTGDAVLEEASTYDHIWGSCLSADDPLAKDPKRWQGENRLGFALMETRDILRRHD